MPERYDDGYCCTGEHGCCGPGSWCCANTFYTHDHDEPERKVVDLMQALQDSLERAKAERRAR